MNGEGFPTDEMRYDVLTQAALRGVIRAALERAAAPDGLPGAHHFYITFKTRAEGVSIPADLSAKYPDEITVVIQHQYWDLMPEAERFTVVLQFGGQPKKLVVPYMAVTRFYDPSVQFVLQFSVESSLVIFSISTVLSSFKATILAPGNFINKVDSTGLFF